MSGILSIGAGGDTGFYDFPLEQSIRFNGGDNPRFTRTPSSTSNRQKFVWSGWVKRVTAGSGQGIFGTVTGSATEFFIMQFTGSDTIFIQGASTPSSSLVENVRLGTTQVFRDVGAWYHIVLAVDTTQATASNRLKLYVNGDNVTDFSSGNNTYPTTQDFNTPINNASFPLGVGAIDTGTVEPFDGYMAEVNFVDGLSFFSDTSGTANSSFNIDSFGETKSGIWIPKQYTGSYGTNGFRLTFEDDTTVEGFNTVTYTGPIGASAAAGTTGTVSGVGFQPDLVWIKNRTNANNHQWFDSVRGTDSSGDQAIISNSTAVESTSNTNGGLISLDSDGFTLKAGTDSGSGRSNNTGSDAYNYVAWCWKAGGAPTADNSAGAGNTPTANSVKIDGANLGSALAGTIPATRLSANTTRGFSIVTYTGTGSAGTIAHGLSAAPTWILVKKRTDDTQAWLVYHVGNTVDESGSTVSPQNEQLTFNTDAYTVTDSTVWNNTAPTSTVFSVGNAQGTNGSGDTYVAYCWTDISGYSKMGSYTGNGSSGHAITTGFEPAWLMVKRADAVNSWYIVDNTRTVNTAAGNDDLLYANLANAEGSTNDFFTFTSTGFELNTNSPAVNTSNGDYIYMAFADTREYAFWTDQSGNNNDFQHTNLEHTDVVPDRPTNNFATFNPLLFNTSPTLDEGNLKATLTSGSGQANRSRLGSTFHITSGKWYWELTLPGTGDYVGFGISRSGFRYMLHTDPSEGVGFASFQTQSTAAVTYYAKDGTASSAISGTGPTVTNIVQIALDADNGKMWVGNGTNFYSGDGSGDITGTSGDPAAGTNASFTSLDFSEPWTPMIEMTGASETETFIINFGQNGDFNNTEVAQGNTDSRGHGDFYYAPPSGFLALCSENLPDPALDPNKGETADEYFNTVTYTGTGASTLSITGVGFQPDWVWAKKRSATDSHATSDVVRGVTKTLFPDVTNAESTDANGLKSFDSDGFTIGSGSGSGVWGGNSGATYVAWNWKAGGSDSTNSVGDLTSQVSVNTEAGFSIVAYTGSDSAATVGHGLGVAPDFVLVKQRTATGNWIVGADIPDWTWTSDYLLLDDTAAKQTNAGSTFFTGAPTSTVLNLGGGSYTSSSSQELIAYCFAEIEGYSKVGTYTGNGSSDGAFVYTGFKPAWVMLKRTNTTGSWKIFDSKRPDPFNVIDARIEADNNGAESTSSSYSIDLISSGFKLRGTSAEQNGSGSTFMYLAFAEQPFKYANAR